MPPKRRARKPKAEPTRPRTRASKAAALIEEDPAEDQPAVEAPIVSDRKPLRCFYCVQGFQAFSQLIAHLKLHEDWTYRLCQTCYIRKRKWRESEHKRKHKCASPEWNEIVMSKDRLMRSVESVYGLPPEKFQELWTLSVRLRGDRDSLENLSGEIATLMPEDPVAGL